MNPTSSRPERCLAVLADGVQAAFAAGAVAELAREGALWRRGAGAGLGAHVALLATVGETAEAERRWVREGELGCPMFDSRLAAARRRAAAERGVALVPDASSLDGWLDPAALAEHLAPELAGVPARLSGRGARLEVAVEDVESGAAEWVDLARVEAAEAGALLRAAAAFPAGWGPQPVARSAGARRMWGGVGVAFRGAPPWTGDAAAWDVVCGFPVPAAARSALADVLLELIQRRSEASAAEAVGRWVSRGDAKRVRVIAPTPQMWRTFVGREGAELGVEYPLPWERNGQLVASLVRFGAFSAGAGRGGAGG